MEPLPQGAPYLLAKNLSEGLSSKEHIGAADVEMGHQAHAARPDRQR
jgi:hypothetical protein